MKILRNIIIALILAATGSYVLWQFHTVVGLGVGVGCILLMLCIAFPTDITPGVAVLKGNIAVIVPVVVDAIKGGARRTDPPAGSDDVK